MESVTPASSDPRAVPRTVERDVLRASLAARLFSEESRVKIGRFVIIDRAGSGGMGVVYRAYDPELEREVALKLLLRKPDREQERLMREARAAAKVVHPNVVSVFEVGTDGDDLFVAMEYVAGSTLRTWAEKRSRSHEELVAMHVAAGRGLAAAHAVGVIHRDYKPDNVLIGPDGRPRVADFGLARSLPAPDDQTVERRTFELLTTLSDHNPNATPAGRQTPTVSGDLLGTPAYMAPEQFLTSSIDARADQYSFCVSLYEALLGRRPFEGRPTFDREPVSLDDSRLNRRIRVALERGLSLEPEERFETMDELLAALSGDGSGKRAMWAGALVLAGVVAAGAALATPPKDAPEPSPACQAMGDAFERVVAPSHTQRLLDQVEHWGLEPREVVERRIDGLRTTWVDVAKQACSEFHLDGATTEPTFDAKMACLNAEARQLDLTLTSASQADKPTRLLPALDSSTSIIDCGIESVVLGHASSHAHEPPEVAALRERYERAEAKAIVYGRASLLAELEEIEAEARTLPSNRLQAETAYELASAYTAVSRYDEAEALLKRTYRLARTMDDVDMAVDTARFLSNFYTAYRDGRHEAAEVWADIAVAELDDPRIGTLTAVATLLSTSHIKEIKGDVTGSLADQQRAATLLDERKVPDGDQLSLKVYSHLSVSYHALGRFEEAETLYRKTISGRLETYPHDRSGNAGILMNFGMMLRDVGRFDEAMQYTERGHAATDKEGRPRRWVQSTTDFVHLLLEDGQDERAETLLREAGDIIDATEGPRRDQSHLLDGWAALHETREEWDEALSHSRRATALALEVTPTDPGTTRMHLRHARLLARAGEVEQAESALLQARSLSETAGPTHPFVAAIELTAAQVAHAAGDQTRARELANAIAGSGNEPHAKSARELLSLWGAPRQ